MIINKISTRKFARHTSVDVDMPSAGVVVVTGKNGHGKSSIVEAVAQGGWNETIRGAPGWRMAAKSGVELHFDGGHVRRSVSDSKHVLKWQVDEDGAGEYPTRTKSQSALESHIGTFHVWKHGCTFHTDDVARFTRATDASRKRLLEEVLELDRIEKGYKKARDKLNAARRGVTSQEHSYDLAQARCQSLADQLQLLGGELEQHENVDTLREAARLLKAALLAAEETARAAAEVVMQARTSATTKAKELADHAARVRRFKAWSDPLCAVCEQPMDEEHRADVLAGAKLEHLAALAEHSTLTAAVTAAEVWSASARTVSDHARLQYAQAVEAGKSAVATAARNAGRQTKIAALDEEHARAVTEARAQLEELAQLRVSAEELAAAVQALSFQGVRAALLDGAVRGLQDLANDWLARLGLAHMTVELSSQSESKAGTVSDKISFDVIGAGGGYGYKGASTGERRRLDIAMMFALGELAAQSRGVSPQSTLFIDEVFDGLDEDGRDAVVVMLNEISQDRCVVVITHNKELTSRLKPVLRLRAEEGELTQDRRG